MKLSHFIFLTLLALFAFGAFAYTRKKNDIIAAAGLEPTFKLYGNKHDVPYLRAMAIGMKESSLRPIGTHPDGISVGVMGMTAIALDDVNQHYGTSFAFSDLLDPTKNIEAGILYLKLCTRILDGDLDKGTRGYHSGYGRIRNNPTLALDYLQQVLQIEQTLTEQQ